ncbi:syn-copalyl diphosphate synthase-like [Triticum dicoccoides]|uniref:syn-copalyl diphosphate synthase-like n=1 Tax=Triticum dicoccoides TaxID=85692 RepID=UPI00188E915B|nr:syn-copalyl diphosphate synthase-like [Triticum dicoccoides]
MLTFTTAVRHVPVLGQPTTEPWRRHSLHLNSRRRQCGLVLASKSPSYPEVEVGELDVDDNRRHMDEPSEMQQMIDAIRTTMELLGDGETSTNMSAYDTALVALVKNLEGGDGPQFPSCIDWIVQNQLPDGSWGDPAFFMVQDRMISTLACVVALKSWKIDNANLCDRGVSFIQENMSRLVEDEQDWMPSGFEINFPALLDRAKDLNLDIPYNHPVLEEIYTKRNLKLSKIPLELLHATPTTLLFSLEGMADLQLDWEKLLKLRCPDGSFHSSPASTAAALSQTGDKECLAFLERLVNKFDGGVPCTHAMDIFEQLWVVDRLMRLGISRHFTSEIEQCMDYIYRRWTQKGLAHNAHCPTTDIDDTAMGFRLLRQHGYDVTPSVFKHFEKDGKFVCFPMETNHSSVTPMHNTYRASHFMFPGDDNVLARAGNYCQSFLQERQASNKLYDKWIIAKDLPGEVEYTLNFPWQASLPRIETRMYLDQYGGSTDVWIGKVLYRMKLVSNDLYLKMAKADFKEYQRLSRLEWNGLRKWYFRNHLQRYGGTPKSALTAYFLASANIFEPGRAAERLGWARMAVLAGAVTSHFRHTGGPKGSTENLEDLIDLVSFDDASGALHEAWKQWLMAWTAKESRGSIEGDTALLLVRTVEICSGRHVTAEQNLNLWDYSQLEQLTSSICRKLATIVLAQNGVNMENTEDLHRQVNLEMQELSWHVHQGCHGINIETRKTFLNVVKSFYYSAHCSHETVDSHIAKVILQDVI